MKDVLLNMTVFFLAVASFCQTIQIVRLRTKICALEGEVIQLLTLTGNLIEEIQVTNQNRHLTRSSVEDLEWSTGKQ